MNISNILKNKKIDSKKLLKYGFVFSGDKYIYSTKIFNNEFLLNIEFDIANINAKSELFEISSGELYTLHFLADAEGEFVGKIKQEYENIIEDIKSKCFETGVFEWEYTYKVIDYCKSKYGDEPEYLWEKTPRNAICRRKDNKKWYLALLSVKGDKLGLESAEIIEVINLRAYKNDIPKLLENDNIYPAYHMNKKSWFTIILDGSVNIDEIFKMIDISYQIADKK